MGNNKTKNKAIGNSPLDSICSNSKNSSNRSGTPTHKTHSNHSSNHTRSEETYETRGSGEYVPHDPYLYNLIKSAIEENNREEERKSKGFFSKLFRRK